MRKRILPYLAIVLIALLGSYGISRSLNDSQNAQNYRACLSDNALRRLLNAHIRDTASSQSVVLDFARSAATTRLASYRRTHLSSDLKAARAYFQDYKLLLSIRYERLPLNRCKSYA